MSLKCLIELLKKELKIHEKILIAKRDERRWIATANAPALLESSQYLRKLTEEAADLERKRRHIVDTLTTQLGIENPEPSCGISSPSFHPPTGRNWNNRVGNYWRS